MPGTLVKSYKYRVFCDRYFTPPGVFFFRKAGYGTNWSGGEVVLEFDKLVDAKKFMSFAKLFGCTYE